MQLSGDISKITGVADGVTVWDAKKLSTQRNHPQIAYLHQAIDEMGQGSKVAQGLATVLTSVARLRDNPTHRLYLYTNEKLAVGILKIGVKKLFIRARGGQLIEMEPLCVLDFYVHESQQRTGYGKVLFEEMLEREGISPHRLGYDRPSPKFLSFLRKHYSLSEYVSQSNNFVVFDRYFQQAPARASNGSGSSGTATATAQRSLAPPPARPHAPSSGEQIGLQSSTAAAVASMRPSHATSTSLLKSTTSSRAELGLSRDPFGHNADHHYPATAPSRQPNSLLSTNDHRLKPAALNNPTVASASLSSSIDKRRERSPTRSGAVGYNIITLAEEGTQQGNQPTKGPHTRLA